VCKYRLHEEEFVRPVVQVVEKFDDVEVFRISELKSESISKLKSESAIVCGTALRDFEYCRADLSFLCGLRYILGICAGYQIIAKLFSAKPEKMLKIGVHEVETIKENPLFSGKFRAYFLHELAVVKLPVTLDALAVQGNEIAAFKVRGKNFYGVSFHPEVINREIIENFVKLANQRTE